MDVLEWRSSFLVGITSSSWGNPFWHENGDLWVLFEVLSNCKEPPLMISVERFHSWCHSEQQKQPQFQQILLKCFK